ncbi:hypothetical protein GXW71_17235 [Roseomonas hellenica]|uniref:Flagellar hook-length control protein FliK n=1 Tax=Plastoroseomonas hellenica TaxID=2687306 RepID=A0ABS5F0N6_9PROT|nr:hypothetical protein [Plastoroseomonas hellenica]MBR0666107.1 hypothetical protein [Plastoroseomonas hellenica]
MNAIGATSALALQPLTAGSDKGASAAAPPTLLDQVASRQRGSFTSKELGEMMAALAPGLDTLPADEAEEVMSGLLGELATRRAAGQDAVLFTMEVPGGGFMATVMSASELARALASDDPASLGYTITDDGKTTYHRDVLRQALGMNDAKDGAAAEGKDALSPKDQVAAAIVAMLDKALREEKAGGEDDHSDVTAAPLSFTTEADGTKVNFFAFPRLAAEAGQSGPGLLLDVQA